MDDFFKTLLLGNVDNPEQVYTDKLLTVCPEAMAIEWFNSGSIHEAIFTERGQEKIARFTNKAGFIDLKTNLNIAEVPAHVRIKVERHGEIMSSILIQELQNYHYEFVMRDKLMRREIIFTDAYGGTLHRKEFPEII